MNEEKAWVEEMSRDDGDGYQAAVKKDVEAWGACLRRVVVAS